MNAKNKWVSGSIQLKIASIGMALSAVLSIFMAFVVWDSVSASLEFLSGVGVDLEGILSVYVLLLFAIDVVVTVGLFFVGRWARNLTIWWGVLSLISIVFGISGGGFTAWLIPQMVTVISAFAVLLAKKDFAKE
jgi:hypothetical protein